MRDSQREPGAYPRHSSSRPIPSQPAQRNPKPKPEPSGQPRPSARRPGMEASGQAPRPRPPLNSGDLPPRRPKLPSAEETRASQFERTERLRALRQDFLDHAQTKVKPQKPRNVWLAVVLTGVLLVLCIVGVVAFFQLRPTLFSSGGQTIATQFMDAMQQKNYTAAYADCSSSVQEAFSNHSGALSQSDFMQQAQQADQVGPITSYTPAGSNSIDSNNTQYTFSVTRSHQPAVNVTIGVTKGDDGSWKVSSVDSALFPAPTSQSGTTPTPTSYPNLPDATSLTHPAHKRIT